MPELPSVEGFRQYLYSTSLHQTISGVEASDAMVLDDVTEADLQEALVGSGLVDTRRHGKWLFADASDGPWLCFHFGMTGHLVYFEEMDDEPEHDRMLISFENGMHLAYDCQRRFGRISLADSVEAFVERNDLGPDALGLSWERFHDVIEGRTAQIKPLLMDQSVIAGLGNVIVDEILFRCRLHPEQHVDTLDADSLREVHGAMGEILKTMVDARTGRGDEIPSDWLMRHRSPGERCPECDGEVERIEVGGRGTYFCPSCQTQE